MTIAAGVAQSGQAQSLSPLQQSISASVASDKSFSVVPFEFDPSNSNLVRATWLTGTGCPATVPYVDFLGVPQVAIDPGCPTGDSKDKKVEGLLLVKTGPTANNAAAGARINGLKQGTPVSELGYDLRKPINYSDPRGSHCGAGAPRFNIAIAGVIYFIGCSSPPPVQIASSNGWIRLRWAAPLLAYNSSTGLLDNISDKAVDSISIIFDEGQDTGPDNFGAAFLDNIDINGQLVGRGPGSGN